MDGRKSLERFHPAHMGNVGPKNALRCSIGIGLQVVLLVGLAYWALRNEVIQYYEPGPLVVDGQTVPPAGLADKRLQRRGPAPGWQLYGVPIEVFQPHFLFIVALLAGMYVGLTGYAVWKKRWLAIQWWILPISLAAIAFFVMTFLAKPRIFY